jgi:hypothetical protein
MARDLAPPASRPSDDSSVVRQGTPPSRHVDPSLFAFQHAWLGFVPAPSASPPGGARAGDRRRRAAAGVVDLDAGPPAVARERVTGAGAGGQAIGALVPAPRT